MVTPTDWEGDRELAKARFLKSAALAEWRLSAEDLNFFAWRLLFQMDSRDVSGLQMAMKASLEAERRPQGGCKWCGRSDKTARVLL
jgi:hypothetical protein